MPVYNARAYVAQAIDSILAQTFTDFEFLILDDGSTDGSLKILKRYAQRDSRIHLVSRENRGIVASLNALIAMAQGEFLARMDADDIALPERLALQIAWLREHPEVVCVGGQYIGVDRWGYDLGVRSSEPTDDHSLQDRLLHGFTAICHPTAMMRRSTVQAVGGYDENCKVTEDLDLWLRLGEQGQLANLPQVLLHYRVHPNSANSKTFEEGLAAARRIADQACDRRGIERRAQPLPRYLPETDRASLFHHYRDLGWVGFMRGDRLMALRYACETIRKMPLRWDGWKLLVYTILKPVRGGGVA